jgi:predicted RNA-binding Zn-ribbon protein involved in translation (DUF1610 family)
MKDSKDPKIVKAWIAAGIALGTDPKALVVCPVCENENIIVQDIPDKNSSQFERIMSCPNCGARNILLMNSS